MKYKILIIDPVNNTDSHVAFNSTIIKALKRNNCNISDLIVSYSQIKHPFYEGLNMNSRPLNGKLFGINIYSYLWFGLLAYAKLIIKIFTNTPNKILFLCVDNTLFYYIIKCIRYIYSGDIYVIVHSNLEQLKNSDNKLRKWERLDAKFEIKFIVLADFLKVEMSKMLDIKNVEVLNNPTYGHLLNSEGEIDYLKRKIDYIFLGGAANEAYQSKFIKKFMDELSLISQKFPSKKLTIGFPSNFTLDARKNINVYYYGIRPNHNKYYELLQNSKFIVIPTSRGNKLSTSGVLADAITHGVLLIAPEKAPLNQCLPSEAKEYLYNDLNLASVLEKTITNQKTHNKLSMFVKKYSDSSNLNYLECRMKIILNI
tara:strand:- start:23483 stop:24592 length:1110 start_codon:yes stop_codon:yes gene_type:complete